MNNLSGRPEFKDFDPMKLALLDQLFDKYKGQSPELVIPQLMKANTELKKRGITFSSDEMNKILNVIMEDMSPAQRQQIGMLMNMMNMRK